MDLQKFLYVSKCTLRLVFIILINIYCIPTYLIWMWVILMPLRLANHPLYWYLEGIMYKWLLCMVASWSWMAQFCIIEVGDDITSCIDQRCLLIVNHQSTADVPMLMAAFHEKGPVLPSLMWIMDRMFRYTNFGAVSMTHGDYFITQGKHVRELQMLKLTDFLLSVFLVRNRQWIVLFPEGGFLSKRKETSSKYAKENNFPDLQRVTLPRVGAIKVIMNALHPEKLKDVISERSSTALLDHLAKTQRSSQDLEPLKWIVDVTIAYPESHNPIDLLAICTASRPPCTTHIHYRKYPVEDVPLDSMESLRDWVYARWSEKETLLDAFYETGKFPCLPCSENEVSCDEVVHRKHPITMSNLWLGFLHVFFLSSSYFHCYMLRRLWSFVF